MVIKAATDGEECCGDDEEATLELANNDESKVGGYVLWRHREMVVR